MPTPVLLTAMPAPTTDTVCSDGCDFTTIQAAIDDESTVDGAAIEIVDPVHTEAGIVVNKNVTIRGLGADATIVQAHQTPGEAPERVFFIEQGSTVVLEKMTIRHGKPGVQEEDGGGVRNFGTLIVSDCVVTGNVASSITGKKYPSTSIQPSNPRKMTSRCSPASTAAQRSVRFRPRLINLAV